MLVFNILDNSSRLQRRICLFKKAAPCPVKKLNAPLSPFQQYLQSSSSIDRLVLRLYYTPILLAGWLAGKLDKIFKFLGKQSTKMGSRRSIKKFNVLIINQATHLPTSPPPLLLRRIGTDPHMEFWLKVVQISTSCFYARDPIRPLWGPGSDLIPA
jgi:hypothetical protein